jgi:anaerobic ribonucleoside-triphosphate reductase activating protein
MNYGQIDTESVVDGDGMRVTLFVSGCRNHCKGCFNPATWNFDFGKEFTPIEENEIFEALKPKYIDGLTVVGGEPFEEENQRDLLPFLKRFKEKYPDKTLWIFTGYVYDKDLVPLGKKYIPGVTDEIVKMVDVLVDGPFIQEQRSLELKFRGSANQRLLDRETIHWLRFDKDEQ